MKNSSAAAMKGDFGLNARASRPNDPRACAHYKVMDFQAESPLSPPSSIAVVRITSSNST